MSNEEFIKKIAAAVKKYAPKYNIKVYSPIIAQAILESAWGKSKLASYNNFFGLKAGANYKGEVVIFNTNEEVNGKIITIKDTFRSFKTLSSGVKGYFDFINTDRYKALKGETDPKKYLEKIKATGYATASNYVSSVYSVIEKYDLTDFDPKSGSDQTGGEVEKAVEVIARDIIKNTNIWGVGTVRRDRLYNRVQSKINELMR